MKAMVLMLLASLSALATAQDPERIVKPEIRKGDVWTYRTTNMLVPGIEVEDIRIENSDGRTIQAVVVRKSDDKEFDATTTSEWNPVVAGNGAIFSPPPQFFKFPMRPGDTRTIAYSVSIPRKNVPPTRYEADVKVVGWEEVTVAAGKFRAMKIGIEGIFFPPFSRSPDKFASTFWYVPQVRRWVKFLYVSPNTATDQELLEYKLNED